MGTFVIIAIRNLRQGGRRTVLLALALGIVTCLLVLLMSLASGVSDSIVRAATTLSAGHVNVAGFFKPGPRNAAPIITERRRIREIARKNTPGLRYLIDRHRGWASLVSDTSTMFAGLSGVNAADESALFENLQLAAESEYKEGGREEVVGDPRRLAEPDTVLLFAGQARRLEVGVGDRVTIRTDTMRGVSNTKDVTVVAVVRDLGLLSNWTVFVPRQTILELYQLKEDTTGAVMLYLDDIDKADEVMGKLREVFAREGFTLMEHDPVVFWQKFERVVGEDWVGQKVDLTTWRDEVDFLTWVLQAIDSVSFVLITILAILIAVGIMNAMWIAVRERTVEVGTLRAIGMSRRRVLAMFLTEALLLGFFATALGAALGAGIASAIDAARIQVPVVAVQAILMSDTVHLVVHPGQVLAAVWIFTAIAAISTLPPALRAARMRPITAMGHTE